MRFVISSNPENLSAHLSSVDGRTGTIEAEYGDVLIEGSAFTLAHHGSRSDNPAPCLATDLPVVDVVGLSHVDLDSLMGCGVAMGRKYPRAFAEAAAFVDTNGVHKAAQMKNWESQRPFLQAFWAWSEENRYFPPRDGSVTDATEFVEGALDVLDRILAGDHDLLAAGAVWAAKEDELNRSSLVEAIYEGETGGAILLRQSYTFVNHLYCAPNGKPFECVVAHNPKQGSVTLSFSDADKFTAPEFEGAVARHFVQKLWGPEAGGHAGIAGSPRDSHLTLDDARELVELIKPYF